MPRVAFVAVLAFAFFPTHFGLAARDGTATLSFDSPKVTLAIRGMSCESCASGVRKSLRSVSGVSDASVTYEDGLAVVAIDENSPPKTDALVNAVAKAGFDATSLK
jgi:copper chaperone CopZ